MGKRAYFRVTVDVIHEISQMSFEFISASYSVRKINAFGKWVIIMSNRKALCISHQSYFAIVLYSFAP